MRNYQNSYVAVNGADKSVAIIHNCKDEHAAIKKATFKHGSKVHGVIPYREWADFGNRK